MIKKEFYKTRLDGVNLYRSYSDTGYRIQCDQTEAIYDEAVDVEGAVYTYTETNTPLQDEITDSQALNILLGRGINYGLPDGNETP